MKIKTGKQTAFEVKFSAESWIISRSDWNFFLPYIEVTHAEGAIGIYFCAFFWTAGVSVEKVKK